MHKNLSRVFALWVAVSVGICGAFLFGYWAEQQNYRTSFDDPQVQMAEDAATALATGAELDQVVPIGTVDLKNSLAPWLAVYNATGVPLRSSGQLNGAPPQLPPGVFAVSTWKQYAEDRIAMNIPSDETRFTWLPENDVRQAVVLVHETAGGLDVFVAAGRNMREVENREAVLTEGAAILWGATELGTLIILTVLASLSWL